MRPRKYPYSGKRQKVSSWKFLISDLVNEFVR